MMIESWGDRRRAVTLGADKGYDAKTSSWKRELNVRPHVTQNTNGRRSAIDRRITRHRSYAMSQRIRKRIEEAFGWIKTVAGLRKTKFRGLARVDLALSVSLTLAGTAMKGLSSTSEPNASVPSAIALGSCHVQACSVDRGHSRNQLMLPTTLPCGRRPNHWPRTSSVIW